MPYVKNEVRDKLDNAINNLISRLRAEEWNPGAVNYAISRILWHWFANQRRYATINAIVGVLECIKLEFYRRCAVGYEEGKRSVYGDLKEAPSPFLKCKPSEKKW